MTEVSVAPVAAPSLTSKLRSLRLIDNARRDLHRLWSIRIALAYAVFTGMAMVLSAFVDVFNPWFLLGISVFVSIAIVVLRLVKQAPGEPPMEPVA